MGASNDLSSQGWAWNAIVRSLLCYGLWVQFSSLLACIKHRSGKCYFIAFIVKQLSVILGSRFSNYIENTSSGQQTTGGIWYCLPRRCRWQYINLESWARTRASKKGNQKPTSNYTVPWASHHLASKSVPLFQKNSPPGATVPLVGVACDCAYIGSTPEAFVHNYTSMKVQITQLILRLIRIN